VQLEYDPEKISYGQILDFFFRMHDPTTANRQGPDVGTQYRSVIFTHGREQEEVAKSVTEQVQKQWYKEPITTEIIPAGKWWDAEEYHQLYLHKSAFPRDASWWICRVG
jgi:peptide-methionine (S)-S-oxide reductase